MQINSVSTFHNNAFKSNYTTNNDKYRKYLEKKDYIDKKVETLEILSTIAFIGALLTGAMNIDFSKKLKTIEKISIGLITSACVLLGAKWIKQCQLSKQYDKENNNDSKSYAKN